MVPAAKQLKSETPQKHRVQRPDRGPQISHEIAPTHTAAMPLSTLQPPEDRARSCRLPPNGEFRALPLLPLVEPNYKPDKSRYRFRNENSFAAKLPNSEAADFLRFQLRQFR